MKIDGQQPIGRPGHAYDLVGGAADRRDVRVD